MVDLWGVPAAKGLCGQSRPSRFTRLSPATQASEIDERRIQSCVHFMTLKKLNRLAHIRLKKGRDQTHEVQRGLGGRQTRTGI